MITSDILSFAGGVGVTLVLGLAAYGAHALWKTVWGS